MKTTALGIALAALVLLAAPVASHAEDGVGKRMDLSFEDAPIRTVITQIAEHAGANVIMSPKLRGAITLKLHNVPWRDALEQVARAVGARVLEEDYGILRVLPAAEAPTEKQFVKIHDVRDLMQAGVHVLDVSKPYGRRGHLSYSNGRIVLRAPAAEQKLYAEFLASLRAKQRGKVDLADLRKASAEAQRKLAEVTARLAAAKAGGDGNRIEAAEAQAEVERAKQSFMTLRKEAARAAARRALGGKLEDTAAPKIVKLEPSVSVVTVEGTKQVLLVIDDKGNILEKKVIGESAPKKVIKGRVVDGSGVKVAKPVTVVTTKKGTYRVVYGPEGKIRGTQLVRAGKKSDRVLVDKFAGKGDPLRNLPLPGNIDILKQRKRLEELLKARNHLTAAGLHEESRRVHARVEEARAALAAAEKQREAAAQRAAAERAWREAAAHSGLKIKYGPGQVRHKTGVEDSIQALRKDVAALRGEVRELTGLVRQLLRRGGGGGAGGRGGR